MIYVSRLEKLIHGRLRVPFFHGNYCGPGSRGGDPTDDLDRACMLHDLEYDRSRRMDEDSRLSVQVKADLYFVCRATRLSQDRSKSRRLRLKAAIAARYFARRLMILRALRVLRDLG